MKVSIILPYNKDRGYLKEAIASAEAQTYKDIEIVPYKSDNGVSHNINQCVKRSTGTFIKLLADDDIMPPDCIQNMVSVMEDNDFIHGKAMNFTNEGQKTIHEPSCKIPTLSRLLSKNHIHGGTTMYRRDIFERFGGYDETLWTGEELDFHLMLLSKGARIGYCDHVVYFYRIHSGQKSSNKTARGFREKRRLAIIAIRDRYR